MLPALENLPRTKPRGACAALLWGKQVGAADVPGLRPRRGERLTGPGFGFGGGAGADWCSIGHFWVGAGGGFRSQHERPWRLPLQDGVAGLCAGDVGAFSDGHAALRTGGARDRGVWPRAKVSMTIMGPPQHGHGWRRVRVATASAASMSPASGFASGGSAWSSRRMVAMLRTRALLAKRPPDRVRGRLHGGFGGSAGAGRGGGSGG